MAFSSITRAIARTALGKELVTKLDAAAGFAAQRRAKTAEGLVASALAQSQQRPLLAIAAT